LRGKERKKRIQRGVESTVSYKEKEIIPRREKAERRQVKIMLYR